MLREEFRQRENILGAVEDEGPPQGPLGTSNSGSTLRTGASFDRKLLLVRQATDPPSWNRRSASTWAAMLQTAVADNATAKSLQLLMRYDSGQAGKEPLKECVA